MLYKGKEKPLADKLTIFEKKEFGDIKQFSTFADRF
jgi:hypothetical protein